MRLNQKRDETRNSSQKMRGVRVFFFAKKMKRKQTARKDLNWPLLARLCCRAGDMHPQEAGRRSLRAPSSRRAAIGPCVPAPPSFCAGACERSCQRRCHLFCVRPWAGADTRSSRTPRTAGTYTWTWHADDAAGAAGKKLSDSGMRNTCPGPEGPVGFVSSSSILLHFAFPLHRRQPGRKEE